jgi:hypothetical protein
MLGIFRDDVVRLLIPVHGVEKYYILALSEVDEGAYFLESRLFFSLLGQSLVHQLKVI